MASISFVELADSPSPSSLSIAHHASNLAGSAVIPPARWLLVSTEGRPLVVSIALALATLLLVSLLALLLVLIMLWRRNKQQPVTVQEQDDLVVNASQTGSGRAQVERQVHAPAQEEPAGAESRQSAEALVEEQTEFTVELTEIDPTKISVIKAVRELTGMDLRDGAVEGPVADIGEANGVPQHVTLPEEEPAPVPADDLSDHVAYWENIEQTVGPVAKELVAGHPALEVTIEEHLSAAGAAMPQAEQPPVPHEHRQLRRIRVTHQVVVDGKVVDETSAEELIPADADPEPVRARLHEQLKVQAEAHERELGGQSEERVHFTAFHPLVVVPEHWYSLVIYTHVPAARESVRADVVKRFREAVPGIVNEVGVEATQPIARSTLVTIVPECEGVTFNPAEHTFRWFEDQQSSEFRFMAGQEHLGRSLRGEIAVRVGPLQIASLDLTFLCRTQEEADRMGASNATESEGKLYETVFASYSHRDAEIALACRNAYRALGLHVYIDLDSLRSGDSFGARLMELIRKADAFQLFWSHNSAQSDWVQREWEYALSLDREANFIRPVFWDRPPVPAPAALRDLHFRYVPLARLVGSDDNPYASGDASASSTAAPQPPPAEKEPSEPVPVPQPVLPASQAAVEDPGPATDEHQAPDPKA